MVDGRFNSGGGEEEENAIITSTGCYVVAWDFAKVKKNKLDSYVIKKCVFAPLLRGILLTVYFRFEDMVVQDNFRHGDANEIVPSFNLSRRRVLTDICDI